MFVFQGINGEHLLAALHTGNQTLSILPSFYNLVISQRPSRMPHDKRARFLGRRARAALEEGEGPNDWELGSVVSRSTRSSTGSSSSASSRSDSSSDDETVDEDGTEVDYRADGRMTRSIVGDTSFGDAMEIDTLGWNEDAEVLSPQTTQWVRPALSHAAFTQATAIEAPHLKPSGPAQVSVHWHRMNFRLSLSS